MDLNKIKYPAKTTATGIATLIQTAITNSNTANESIQIAAVSILSHAARTNDYRGANDLVKGLSNGVRKDALVEFFVAHGLIVDNDNPESGFAGYDKDKLKNAETLTHAKTHAWFNAKAAKNPFKGFDLTEQVQRVIKKSETTQKKDLSPAEKKLVKIDSDLLNALRSVRNATPAQLKQIIKLVKVEPTKETAKPRKSTAKPASKRTPVQKA
jgi:hypothetical protein